MKLKPIERALGAHYPVARPDRRRRGVRLRHLGSIAALCFYTGCAASSDRRSTPATNHESDGIATSAELLDTPPASRRPSTDDDRDSDGIPDVDDRCPIDEEDRDGFDDDDGCPDPDNDGDTIVDSIDACPNSRENFNGFDDEDGCPDRSAGIIVSPTNIQIVDKIFFPDGATDVPLKARPILDAVAATLKGNPQIVLVEIQGHSDERGGDESNTRTSQIRADAVLRYLVQPGGVESNRLRAKGFGERCPNDPRHTDEAWKRNRRVEFKIVRTTDGDAEDPLPCEAARDLSPRGP